MTGTQQGYLTLAVGSRHYLEWAVDMAMSLREHTELPLALATDERLGAVVERLYPGVFDHTTLLPGRFRTGRAAKYGCADVTPFRETVFVDADCIVLGSLDGLFDVLRNEPLAMLGERLTRDQDRVHHGFSTRWLMERFALDRYLKTNSGIFAFREDASDTFEECLDTYLQEVRPRLRWRALLGRWVGDEIAFGVVGGRREVALLPEPGPMLWPDEIEELDLARPARPLFHLIHPPPERVAAALVSQTAERREAFGLPARGQEHIRREVARVKRGVRGKAVGR